LYLHQVPYSDALPVWRDIYKHIYDIAILCHACLFLFASLHMNDNSWKTII